jgi:hypothetical protein
MPFASQVDGHTESLPDELFPGSGPDSYHDVTVTLYTTTLQTENKNYVNWAEVGSCVTMNEV